MTKNTFRIYAILSYFLSLITPVFWGEWESLGAIILYYGLTGILLEGQFLWTLPWLANWIFFLVIKLCIIAYWSNYGTKKPQRQIKSLRLKVN